MKINSDEISVIVQGPVQKEYIKKTLSSIREYLPNAEIILSCWKGDLKKLSEDDLKNLSYDILVENEDPGGINYELGVLSMFKDGKLVSNVNRQIVSTINGLKKASKKYSLKFRSDMVLTGDNFLNYFDKYQKGSQEFKIFEKRIIIPTVYTRNPDKYINPSLYLP